MLARLSRLRPDAASFLRLAMGITRGGVNAMNELGRVAGGEFTVATDATLSGRLAPRENTGSLTGVDTLLTLALLMLVPLTLAATILGTGIAIGVGSMLGPATAAMLGMALAMAAARSARWRCSRFCVA